MQKPIWKTTSKMLMLSEHSTFNSKCDYIATGNVYSGVQTSSFIRSSGQLECNGTIYPKEHLQNCDLAMISFSTLHARERAKIKELTDLHNGSILYKFFHVSKGVKVTHGFVLTDEEYNHLRTFMHSQSNKSYSVINECKKYICNGY